MKDYIQKILILIGICTVITLFWELLEFIFYGHIMQSKSDTVIAIILTWSLYYNLKK